MAFLRRLSPVKLIADKERGRDRPAADVCNFVCPVKTSPMHRGGRVASSPGWHAELMRTETAETRNRERFEKTRHRGLGSLRLAPALRPPRAPAHVRQIS